MNLKGSDSSPESKGHTSKINTDYKGLNSNSKSRSPNSNSNHEFKRSNLNPNPESKRSNFKPNPGFKGLTLTLTLNVNNVNDKKATVKLRGSSHKLNIEIGRYKSDPKTNKPPIARENRICNFCFEIRRN